MSLPLFIQPNSAVLLGQRRWLCISDLHIELGIPHLSHCPLCIYRALNNQIWRAAYFLVVQVHFTRHWLEQIFNMSCRLTSVSDSEGLTKVFPQTEDWQSGAMCPWGPLPERFHPNLTNTLFHPNLPPESRLSVIPSPAVVL